MSGGKRIHPRIYWKQTTEQLWIDIKMKSLSVRYILTCYFTPERKYNWLKTFLTFLSDDYAHHMKLKATIFSCSSFDTFSDFLSDLLQKRRALFLENYFNLFFISLSLYLPLSVSACLFLSLSLSIYIYIYIWFMYYVNYDSGTWKDILIKRKVLFLIIFNHTLKKYAWY